MIELKDVVKVYDTKGVKTEALKGISLCINDGEFVAIVGPSGSGKSTLLNILGCMDTVTSGEYILNGKNVESMNKNSIHNLRKNEISFVFQNFALLDQYTVLENAQMNLVAKNVPAKERKKIVMDILEQLKIADLAGKKPSRISGGQQQRVAIARALASGNNIILADEPTGAIDQKMGEEIMNLLRQINDTGKTVILITHDEKIAGMCDRIIRISDGRIVENTSCDA